MKRILLFVIGIFVFATSNSQGLFYSCPRTITLGCDLRCTTIVATFPDIRSQTTEYSYSRVSPSGCLPYTDPSTPGPSANLTIDDRYSTVITMPFQFSFFGSNYNQLVASTNGYVSFDITRATLSSHWQNFGNLPNTSYDKALIMGPYHDLYPQPPASSTSPTQQVKYEVIGSAPNRKWLLSFYKLPLFDCEDLIQNTHQIVLHETSGIVEVYIQDMEICNTWPTTNPGRSLLGMQNMNRDKGVMVAGHTMSDPPWGSIGMDEFWRFIPKAGPTLYRKVELVDAGGAVVAVGDTIRTSDNSFSTTFASVCPPPNSTTVYFVKTTYAKPDGSGTYFSLDQVTVITKDKLPVSATSTPTLCGQFTGTVTATASGGVPPYVFSIDYGGLGGGVFTGLGQGNHTVIGVDALGCSDTISVYVDVIPNIPGGATTTATGCPGVNNGTFTVTPTGGVPPYTYSMDGGAPQTTGVFTGVSAGAHTVIFTDVNGCSGTVTKTVAAGSQITSTASSVGTSCSGASDGSITITPTSGTGPYTYSIDGGTYGTSNTFPGLSNGSHSISIKDASGCTGTRTVTVSAGAGLSITLSSTSTFCPGSNTGTIIVTHNNGTGPFTYTVGGVPAGSTNPIPGMSSGIKTVTVKDANGCTGTGTVAISNGSGITGSGTASPAGCTGGTGGTITLTAATGTAPFTYSIDGGSFQSSNIFTSVSPGNHPSIIKDANGCTVGFSVNVGAGSSITGTATTTPTACSGATTGTITVTPTSGATPFSYSIDGTTFQASNIFTGLGAGPKVITIKDVNNCSGTVNVTVTAGATFSGAASTTPTACPGVNNGSVTVTAVGVGGTGPYTYSINGTTFQAANIFTGVAAGPQVITIKDANGCLGTINVTVAAGTTITGTATTTATACPGVNNGSVTATATSGTAPYTYSINGTTFQASNIFTGVAAGAQTITIKDANGCTGTVPATVSAGTTILGTATEVKASCTSASNGSITATPTNGTAPYTYSINGTTFQASNTFSGLAPNAYTITIKDASGCTGPVNISVTAGPGINATAATTPTACPGVNNGSITVTANAGQVPYQYSIDGTTFQSSNIFTAVSAGSQTINIKDANGCTFSLPVNVPAGATITGTATEVKASCTSASNGSITATPTNGTAPYTYSINGTTFQASNTFSGLAPNAYIISIKDVNGCIGTVNISVTAGPGINATAATTPTACPGVNNGSITVTANAGATPYQYSINGTTFQASNVFTAVSAGAQIIDIKDANGCTFSLPVTVPAGTTITGTATQTASSCPVANDGSLTVTATSGTAPYTYSINGTTFQASNTFNNLLAGPYIVSIKDVNGCVGQVNITVNPGPGITGNVTSTPSTCAVAPNASLTATATSGVAPYKYSIDGSTFQNSNVFNNILSGSYTVTFKDALGCTGTTPVTVSTGTGLTGTGTTIPTSCPDVNNGGITVTPTVGLGTAPFTYALDGGTSQATGTFTNVSAGAHSVIFTDALGCTGTVPLNVPAGAAVTGTATTVSTSCPTAANGSATVTPTNGTAPYTYAIDGGTPQASGTFNNLLAGNHSVTFKDANGCIGPVNFTVPAGAVITGTAASTGTSCPGINNGTITVTTTTGTAPFKFSLDGGTFQNSNIFTAVAHGNHTITFTDNVACTSSTINVTVAEGAAITGSAEATPTTCPGVNNGKIVVTPATGTAPYRYSLNGGALQNSNTFSNLAPGTYSLTFTDANGCSGPATATVAEGAGLISTATSVATSCPGVNNGSITVNPTTGTTPYQYTLESGTPQASPTFTGLASGSFTISIKDALGCTGTVTETVTPGVALTSTVNPTQPVCFSINDGVIEINPTSGTSPYLYTITGAAPQNGNTFSNLAPGIYSISFTDAIGCTGTNSATLITNPEIVLTGDKTDPLCFGSTDGTITISTVGGVSPYSYSIDGGTNYQASNTFTGLGNGSYTITVKDNAGCKKPITVALSQPTKLTASATSPAPSTCLGGDGQIEVSGAGGTPPYTYSIDNGVTYPFQSGTSFTVPKGSYNDIRVKDANGCLANASVTVAEIDNMFLKIGNDTTICQGEPVLFDIQTNAETNIFKWRDSIGLNNDSIKNPTATPQDTTVYKLRAQWGACFREDSIKINVKLRPIPDAGYDARICLNDSTIIKGSVSHTSGTVNYIWSPAQYVRNDSVAVTWAVAPATQVYTLTVTDNYGCDFRVTDSVTVIMQPSVPAFAGNDTLAGINAPHRLMGSGGVQYLWTPLTMSGVQIDDPNLQYPTVKLANDANFMVKVTDIAGCIGYDSVYVQVYQGPEYYIPNAFTPNGDGLNDIFRPLPVQMTSQEYFRIFNRFGELVFETNQYLKGWDGTYKGKPQPTGVYVWILKGEDAKGRKVELKGTVTIVR